VRATLRAGEILRLRSPENDNRRQRARDSLTADFGPLETF